MMDVSKLMETFRQMEVIARGQRDRISPDMARMLGMTMAVIASASPDPRQFIQDVYDVANRLLDETDGRRARQ